MKFGIYKAGQGYWVRVITAAVLGVVALAASAWAWQQIALVPMPRSGWRLVLASAPATPVTAGQTVTLLGEADGGAAPELGTAVVRAVQPGTAGTVELTVRELALSSGASAAQIDSVRWAGADTGVTRGEGIPLVEPLYVQAAGVALIVVAAALACFYLVGARAGAVEFLIATDGEMKKVNWSTRKDILGSTWVVIAWSVILATALFTVDALFSSFFHLIGVLQ